MKIEVHDVGLGLEDQLKPLEALRAFQESAHRLNSVWKETEETHEGLFETAYPFSVGFSKILDQIDQWVDANSSTMAIENAYDVLKGAGLYVRLMDSGDIIGGSHYDASKGSIRTIENFFQVLPQAIPGAYTVITHTPVQTIEDLPLEGAVALVLDTVKPQPNIEGAPRVPAEGPICY